MFEIELNERGKSPRQINASKKALSDKPPVFMITPDTYKVEGFGNSYVVRFFRSDDKIFADCECEAGQNRFPCYHAMRAYIIHYAPRLVRTGRALLNRQPVGGLGFIGTKAEAGEVIELQVGQVFEPAVAVRLTVERI